MTIEEFIEKCQKREIPANPMARIRLLARELAEGASLKLWSTQLDINSQEWQNKVRPFLHSRVVEFDHNTEFPLFRVAGYLTPSDKAAVSQLTKASFDLLEEADPATIFISYSRNESSPFALYTLEKLKQAGLDAFLDIDLKVGDEWHGRLEKQIREVDIFVVIIGAETLKSEYVQKEIRWATGKTIYPIWESSFVNKKDKWDGVPANIAEIMQSTQAIEIPKEHPQHYLTAITQLLNRFGITP